MGNLKEYFENQCEKLLKTKFNIFSTLHKETDEVRLHSRFIAYLLSQDSNHGMGNEFLKLFVNSVLNIDFDCENYTVKTEDKNIDILVFNEKQEIIIENKIYAGDQPRQLIKYYDARKKENTKGEREVVKVIYLTLGGHRPSEDSRGNIPLELLKYIDYTQEINNWLSDCIKITKEKDDFLSKTLFQYKELVTKLTSDIRQATKNQEKISKNIEYALELEKGKFFTEKCKEIFKHVKWHTVADFY